MNKCTAIDFIETINEECDILKVTIDGVKTAYMLASYGETLKYVGEEVIVSYRKDLYKGEFTDFVNTLTIPVTVTTLDKTENIKLYTTDKDNFSNVCFKDILEGEHKLNAEMYCSEHIYESSKSATWATLTVRDNNMRIAKLRLFDYDSRGYNFAGQYIRADIRKSKFGFQTDKVLPLNDGYIMNPEIAIAKEVVLSVFKDNEEINKVIEDTNLMAYLEEFVYLERGYGLVLTAYELSIAGDIENMLPDVDVEAIKIALLLDKLYTCNTESKWSITIRNFVSISKTKFEKKSLVLQILDKDNEDECVEREIYQKIKDMSAFLISKRKES